MLGKACVRLAMASFVAVAFFAIDCTVGFVMSPPADSYCVSGDGASGHLVPDPRGGFWCEYQGMKPQAPSSPPASYVDDRGAERR